MKALARVIACAVVLVALLASCARGQKKPTASTATRVVSMAPATTEALFAIGAGPLVVGRSRYCDYPPEVRALPEVGGYLDPSFEAILALHPDLAVGVYGQAAVALAEKLEARGIKTYFPRVESIDAIAQMIAGVGERTGRTKEAAATAAALRDRVAAIERAVAGKPKARVLMVVGVQPIVVVGPGSFPDEMLRRAGAENVVSQGGEYPMLGMERVIALDPDVVINGATAEANGASRISAEGPGWGSLRAVEAGRVVIVDDERVLRPGPRIADGLAVMARALHPDAALP